MLPKQTILARAEAVRAARPPRPHPTTIRIAEAKQRAEATLADFAFTRLVESEEVEVWRCRRQSRSIYSHDITITSCGIAVMGDMDGLLFNVGSDRGMKFLAGDDVGYYMHSKLEEQSKETEFNRDGFLGFVAQELQRKTQDQVEFFSDFRASVPDEGVAAEALALVGDQDPYHQGEDAFNRMGLAIQVLGSLDKSESGKSRSFALYAADATAFIEEVIAAAESNSIDEVSTFLREDNPESAQRLESMNRVIRAATEDALDAGCKTVQDAMGVTTGDLAGMYFSGLAVRGEISRALCQYVNAELAERVAEQLEAGEMLPPVPPVRDRS